MFSAPLHRIWLATFDKEANWIKSDVIQGVSQHKFCQIKLLCSRRMISQEPSVKRQSWHYKWKVCSGYCIDHAKFKIF